MAQREAGHERRSTRPSQARRAQSVHACLQSFQLEVVSQVRKDDLTALIEQLRRQVQRKELRLAEQSAQLEEVTKRNGSLAAELALKDALLAVQASKLEEATKLNASMAAELERKDAQLEAMSAAMEELRVQAHEERERADDIANMQTPRDTEKMYSYIAALEQELAKVKRSLKYAQLAIADAQTPSRYSRTHGLSGCSDELRARTPRSATSSVLRVRIGSDPGSEMGGHSGHSRSMSDLGSNKLGSETPRSARRYRIGSECSEQGLYSRSVSEVGTPLTRKRLPSGTSNPPSARRSNPPSARRSNPPSAHHSNPPSVRQWEPEMEDSRTSGVDTAESDSDECSPPKANIALFLDCAVSREATPTILEKMPATPTIPEKMPGVFGATFSNVASSSALAEVDVHEACMHSQTYRKHLTVPPPTLLMQKVGSILTSKMQSKKLLDLRGNNISEHACQSIAEGLKDNQILNEIYLNKNRLGDKVGMTIAQALATNRTLEVLGLSDTGLGDKGGVALAHALRGNATLKTLFLTGNALGPASGISLGQMLLRNRSLRSLWLGGNALGDDGGLAIVKALGENHTLQSLLLQNCNLGDRVGLALLEVLKVNKTLTVLKLGGNHFSAHVRHSLMNCKMEGRTLHF